LEWQAPAGGGGFTLLSTTTLSGASTTISSINQGYEDLYVEVELVENATANGQTLANINTTTGKITGNLISTLGGGSGVPGYAYAADDNINMTYNSRTRTDTNNFWAFHFYNYASTTSRKSFQMIGGYIVSGAIEGSSFFGYYNENTAISELKFTAGGGNWSGGTVRIYGVK